MFLDPDKTRAEYAGIEVIHQGHRFVYSVYEILEVIMGISRTVEEVCEEEEVFKQGRKKILDDFINKDDELESELKESAIKEGFKARGNICFWQPLAEEFKQEDDSKDKKEKKGKNGKKDKSGEKTNTVSLSIAARRIGGETPSKRYIYDYGSRQQFKNDHMARGKLYATPGKFTATDAIKLKERISYPDLRRNICGGASPVEIVQAIRAALRGQEPPDEDTVDAIRAQVKNDAAKFIELKKQYTAGEITLQKFKEEGEPLKVWSIKLESFQNGASDPLTNCMVFHSATAIPTLIGTWFVAEFSRNRATYIVSKVLLDLIEVGAKLSSGGTPITFENSLWHPDIPMRKDEATGYSEEALTRLKEIGGLHPMCHEGSYSKDFGKDGHYRLDRENLSWSHVKSGVVICEWFCLFLSSPSTKVRILSKEQYEQALKNSPMLEPSSMLNQLYATQTGAQQAVTVESLRLHGDNGYCEKAGATIDARIRQALFELALDFEQKLLLPKRDPGYTVGPGPMFRISDPYGRNRDDLELELSDGRAYVRKKPGSS